MIFPSLVKGVSTERGSSGFETLMRRFVTQNMYKFTMFLDGHAVNASALGKDGYYNGFYITPHGVLWKVHDKAQVPSYAKWHKETKDLWKRINVTFPLRHAMTYHNGTWEFVARSIYYDGLYQKALHALQHWVDRSATFGKQTPFDEIDTYLFGLRDVVASLNGIYHAALPVGAITYPRHDIVKNLALSYVRYHGALTIADHQPDRDLPISKQLLSDVQEEAVRIAKELIALVPMDKDIDFFQTFVNKHDETNGPSSSTQKMGNHHHEEEEEEEQDEGDDMEEHAIDHVITMDTDPAGATVKATQSMQTDAGAETPTTSSSSSSTEKNVKKKKEIPRTGHRMAEEDL